VKGRSSQLRLNDAYIVIGKTDNVDAMAAILAEARFNVIILGTPRKDEDWRLKILGEVVKADPSVVGLFVGLEDSRDLARDYLKKENYKGSIKFLDNNEDIVDFVIKSSNKSENILIGGNGQNRIIEIQYILEGYAQG
jgi:UDP-N-acetylmuramoylalanine--D-glutamate ligase